MRRPVLITVVLAVAILLGAGGAALAFALSGNHSTSQGGGATQSQTAPAVAGVTSSPAGASATGPPGATSQTSPTSPASQSSTTSPTPATSSSAASLPVLTVGSYSGTRPSEIAYSGDSTNVVTGLSWSSWTATSATGAGTSDIDNCVPSCAAASPNNVATTIKLSAPVNGKFTKMTETRNGSTTNYTYPGNWAQSAS